jgi:hypothetical protein
MRIATWNLESYSKLTPAREVALRQAMAEVKADVWVLTETWLDFSPGAGYKLVAQSFGAVDLKKWPKRCWVEIWVKSNLDARRLEVRKCSDRMACGRIENPGQRDVVVVGTVLPWFGDELFPAADDFCKALKGQVADWGLWGSPRTSGFIFAGDFNQSLPYQKDYGSKKGANALNTAFKTHNLLCLTEGNNPLTGIPRIDHICISPSSLQPLRTPPAGTWAVPAVGGKPITDHSGAYGDLDLPDFS